MKNRDRAKFSYMKKLSSNDNKKNYKLLLEDKPSKSLQKIKSSSGEPSNKELVGVPLSISEDLFLVDSDLVVTGETKLESVSVPTPTNPQDAVNKKYVDDNLTTGDITGVTITTDSGGGSAASDTEGSADFSILGSSGVGVTNSGTTITAVAVPAEIDHDSLNNFVANEHIDWTAASAGTIHATNYSAGASALNDLSDVTYSSGDLTISSLDKIITSGSLEIDSGSNIELNADGGNITFKDDTTELFKIQGGGVRFQDMDGIFFNVDDLDKIYGDGDDIVIAKDDTDVVFIKDAEVTTALPLKVKESANAVADTAAYGQIWIKNNTPNELAFTDDAGTDITGIGKYMYDIQYVGYYSTSAAASYLPINGYIFEQTSTSGRNEYIAFVAPYNGTLEKIMWRSEIAQDGTFRNLIWESTDGTEVPGTIHGRWDPVVDVADDTTVEFDYTATPTSGTNVLTKGRIYAISIDPVSAPNDTNATVVFKWDITS